jgi:zinc protease
VRTQPIEARELERVKNQLRTGFFRSLEPLQGRGSRLLSYEYHTGDPGYIGKDLARYQALDAASVLKAAGQYLRKDARLVITVESNPQAPIMGRIKR